MDIALDTSSFGEMCAQPALLDAVRARVLQLSARLALPLTVMSEISEGNIDGPAARARVVADLADSMGSKFFITQDVGDHLRHERVQSLSSVLRIPPKDIRGVLEACRSKEAFVKYLPELQTAVRHDLGKDKHLERDRDFRDEFSAKFANLRKNLDESLDRMDDDWFWNLVFVDNVSDGGKYRNRIRRYPRRYATATLVAGFDTLTVFGALFAAGYSGRHEPILRGPRRNEWVDSRIAGCAAHARVFLSEDKLQRNKINHVATQFGLRIRARSIEEWLGAPAEVAAAA